MVVAALVALAFAAPDALALDHRGARACSGCEQGAVGVVPVADEDEGNLLEGIPEEWNKAFKERLTKLPVERREAIMKRIRSLEPDQRRALLKRFMGREDQGFEKKSDRRAEKRGDRARQAKKLFEMARKRFEGMGPEHRRQLRRFFSLDEELRGAMMERFREMMQRDGKRGDKKDSVRKGDKRGAKKGSTKKGVQEGAKKDGKRPGPGPDARRGAPNRLKELLRGRGRDFRDRLKRLCERLRERFQQHRDGDRRCPYARRGHRGPRNLERLREELRRHIEEFRRNRDGRDVEHGKKGKDGKKGRDGKKGKKRGRSIIL